MCLRNIDKNANFVRKHFLHLRNIDKSANYVRKYFLRLRKIEQKINCVRKHWRLSVGIGVHAAWLAIDNQHSLRIYFKIPDLSVITLNFLRKKIAFPRIIRKAHFFILFRKQTQKNQYMGLYRQSKKGAVSFAL